MRSRDFLSSKLPCLNCQGASSPNDTYRFHSSEVISTPPPAPIELLLQLQTMKRSGARALGRLPRPLQSEEEERL
ncbi:unnamed protein product [Pleuronectes platessa]|uniref:Uncharacterized protein n=1 Tax=Pleuronectes platessa TaxID=8262 RepID=A0A9N7TX81_PLEPL|nr:unnamed protein product [Pleuronectes platessa]